MTQTNCRAAAHDDNETSLVEAVRLLVEQNATLFVDPFGRPRMRIQNDPSARDWRITDDRVRAWIAKELFDLGWLLSPGQLRAIVEILNGFAWDHGADGRLPTECFDDEPILDAIIDVASKYKPFFERTAGQLLPELTTSVRTHQRNLPKNWPGSPSALSRKLRSLQPALNSRGIALSITRSAKGALVRIVMEESHDDVDGTADSLFTDAVTL